MSHQLKQEFIKALIKFQDECPVIPLDASVSYGKTKFRYATLGQIIKTIRPALSKNGFAFIHCMNGNEVCCQIVHISGESISSGVGIGQSKDAQELGSWITYLKRYTLTSLLGLVAEDDSDGPQSNGVAPTSKKPTLHQKGFEDAIKFVKDGGTKRAVIENYELTSLQLEAINDAVKS